MFPECGPAPQFMNYMPHMTLGQFPNEAAAKTFVALVQVSPVALMNMFLLKW